MTEIAHGELIKVVEIGGYDRKQLKAVETMKSHENNEKVVNNRCQMLLGKGFCKRICLKYCYARLFKVLQMSTGLSAIV